MKVAVIDLGTNTFHLLLAQTEGRKFSVIYREKIAVKIGENGINEGKITPEAEKRAIGALIHFKEIITKNQIEATFATATSAIRNAENGRKLVQKIEEKTGIEVRIISGIEEATYIHYGVTHAVNLDKENSLIMDIGGGSIEFIIANQSGTLWKHSFEIGGLRMVEQFHKHDPILDNEIEKIEEYLAYNLGLLFEKTAKFKPTVLVGSSGTFDTLSDIFRIKNGIEKLPGATESPLTLIGFNEIYNQIIKETRKERLQIQGMIELRVDMIVVASILINFVLKNAGINQIRVSSYALKEGVLLKTMHELPKLTDLNFCN